MLEGKLDKDMVADTAICDMLVRVSAGPALTLEECREIIASSDAKPARPRSKKK